MAGKYKIKINGKTEEAEINTKLPYIGLGPSYFAQGEEAENTIDEIHKIWISGDLTTQQAVQQWVNNML